MMSALPVLLLLTLATPVLGQVGVPHATDKPDLFLAGWLKEQLSRDIPGAVALYQQAAADGTCARSQRTLALARLGEQHWIRGRSQQLESVYQSLAGLGIDLGADRGDPIPAEHLNALGQLSKQFQRTLAKPAGKDRDEELGRLRRALDDYLGRVQRQAPNPRRRIMPRPLLQRVVQQEQQPRGPAEDEELQSLRKRRLKALEQGNHVAARKIQQQINQKRYQLPARDVPIMQRMRGKRMAWLTELHLRNETENARKRERMLFRLPQRQRKAVNNEMRFLRHRSTTDQQRLHALDIVRQRVQHIAARPSSSQWERDVLHELDAQLAEHAQHDEVMEALELVARLPYRYELLQDLSRR